MSRATVSGGADFAPDGRPCERPARWTLQKLTVRNMTDREAYIRQLEDALCGAICVIRNEAGLAQMRGCPGYGETLRKWSDEYEAESGLDFDTVLNRINDPHSKTIHNS